MQEYFRGELDNGKMIGDLPLSEADFRCLLIKVRAICKFTTDAKIIEEYSLSLCVYWVFSYIYYDVEKKAIDEINKDSDKLPQYMRKHFLQMFVDVIEDFGVKTSINKSRDLELYSKNLVMINSLFPRKEVFTYLDVVSKYTFLDPREKKYKKIIDELPFNTKNIFLQMKENIKKEVINDTVKLIVDCLEDKIEVDNIRKRDFIFNNSFIDDVIEWNNRRKVINENAR